MDISPGIESLSEKFDNKTVVPISVSQWFNCFIKVKKRCFRYTFPVICTVLVQYMYSICTLLKRTYTVQVLYIYCTNAFEGICYAPFLYIKRHCETPTFATCWFIVLKLFLKKFGWQYLLEQICQCCIASATHPGLRFFVHRFAIGYYGA